MNHIINDTGFELLLEVINELDYLIDRKKYYAEGISLDALVDIVTQLQSVVRHFDTASTSCADCEARIIQEHVCTLDTHEAQQATKEASAYWKEQYKSFMAETRTLTNQLRKGIK